MVMTTTTPRTARRRQGVLPKSWVIAQISQRFFNFPKFGGYCSDFPLSTIHCFILIHSLPYLWGGFAGGGLGTCDNHNCPLWTYHFGSHPWFWLFHLFQSHRLPIQVILLVTYPIEESLYPMTYPIYFQYPDKMLGFAPHVFVKKGLLVVLDWSSKFPRLELGHCWDVGSLGAGNVKMVDLEKATEMVKRQEV